MIRLTVALAAFILLFALPRAGDALTIAFDTTLTAQVTSCSPGTASGCTVGETVAFGLSGSLFLLDPGRGQVLEADWQDAGAFNSLTISTSLAGLPTIFTTNFGTMVPPLPFGDGNEIAGLYTAFPGFTQPSYSLVYDPSFEITHLNITGSFTDENGTVDIALTNSGGNIHFNWGQGPSTTIGFAFTPEIGASAPVTTSVQVFTAVPVPPAGLLGIAGLLAIGGLSRLRRAT